MGRRHFGLFHAAILGERSPEDGKKVHPEIPFIFVSGTIGEDTATEAMRVGAQDYVLKTNLKRLVPAVQRELREAENRGHLKERVQSDQIILNSIGDAVLSTDLAGNITYLNLAAEKMTGWPCEEAAGRPVAEVFRVRDATSRGTTPIHADAGWAQPRRTPAAKLYSHPA